MEQVPGRDEEVFEDEVRNERMFRTEESVQSILFEFGKRKKRKKVIQNMECSIESG